MNEQDNVKDTTGGDTGGEAKLDASRRAFARKALVGSAAVATLASRPAWGTDSMPMDCVSATTWASYNMGQFSSLTGGARAAEALQERADMSKDSEIVQLGDEYCLVPKQQEQEDDSITDQQGVIGKSKKPRKKK